MRIIVKTALNRDRFERHRSMRYAVICNFKPINQYIFLRRNAEFPFEHSIQSASLETELLAYFGYRKVAVIVAVNIFDHFVLVVAVFRFAFTLESGYFRSETR